MIRRIDANEKAIELIKILQEKHGDLMFYQAEVVAKVHNHSVLKKENFSKDWVMFALEQLRTQNFGLIRIYSNIGNMHTLLWM